MSSNTVGVGGRVGWEGGGATVENSPPTDGLARCDQFGPSVAIVAVVCYCSGCTVLL